MSEIKRMARELRQFSEERAWGQFHSPKNLAAALAVEAAEVLEHFQWLTETQSKRLSAGKCEALADEIADVQIYLVQLADRLGIDIAQAVKRKIVKNAGKYPVAAAYGKAKEATRAKRP